MSSSIHSIPQLQITNSQMNRPLSTPAASQSSFSNTLKAAIEGVNDLQNVSDKQTAAFINGDNEDLHQVMIAAQKASITLETTVQVQKKAIDAYNEMMRMQV
ncbi:flagellar hook-basal body complex protein FliE [Virgibacillus halotolerans]|uniref:flagellar hook-basal body complex protein FliE n=1 Tax=Virgibacillus halotolerans TaxID=1071053 RepID=UPI0019606FBA|nr:flagellar hook-basal body complex protein FliE [Virgibacillus halotolerans]MBM7598599.1 flagellar hook-basal body complex protein FliE [Virgibacillus halotolerans]